MEVVTPAALELSAAAQECERARAALDRQWRLPLERAGQEANCAFRQYNAVEPENRLVARTLERTWEDALLAQRTLEEDYRRFQQAQPVRLSAARARPDRDPGTQSAGGLASIPDVACGKASNRASVVATGGGLGTGVDSRSDGAVALGLRHRDGAPSRAPVHAWRHVIGATDLWQRVQEWQTAGWTSQCIAEELNRKGHRTPRGQPFTAESVRKLIERGGPRLVETRRATARPTKK